MQQFNGTVLTTGHHATQPWEVSNNELKKTKFTPSSYLLCFFVPWLGVSADFFELSTEFEAYLLYSEKLN